MVAYSYFLFIIWKTHQRFLFVRFCWGIMTLSSEFTKCNVTYPVNPFISLIIAHQRIHKRKYCFLGLLLFKSLWLVFQGSLHYQPKQCTFGQITQNDYRFASSFIPPKYDQKIYPSLKLTAFRPWKWVLKGRKRSFSFGAFRPSCEFLGRVITTWNLMAIHL